MPICFAVFKLMDELDRQFPWLQQTVWLLNCWSDFADGYVGLNLPELISGWKRPPQGELPT